MFVAEMLVLQVVMERRKGLDPVVQVITGHVCAQPGPWCLRDARARQAIMNRCSKHPAVQEFFWLSVEEELRYL